jgi:predicted helicase
MRKGRGVYYTPPPIVNFIIRAMDDILKDSFGIRDGLADHNQVTVLDFACGTGTFLLEVFQRIFDNIGGPNSGKADLIVREHILRNLYGFEHLIAPYTIAHLKLSQFLKDRGQPLSVKDRLQVFLTNTLEPIEPQRNLYLPAVTEEVKAAQEVKEKPILVITGNPPYSARSKNRGEWITQAIEAYKYVDGKHFGEKKHWLHDDYVKFIRFAQKKMDGVDRGIVGVITNHAWLDNPTFRGMRQSLMKSFEQIYVFDLHGNSKKKEKTPDGSKDENIFDIEQGVAIALFVKHPELERGVWRGEFWGSRLEKYRLAAEAEISSIAKSRITPRAPFYLFSDVNNNSSTDYDRYWSLLQIFPVNVAGVITARDDFAIGYSKKELLQRIGAFQKSSKSPKELAEEFGLKDTRGWSLARAQKAINDGPAWQENIKPILYRPFDQRFVAHDPRLIDWGRWGLMSSLRETEPSLVVVRQVAEDAFNHVIATTEIADNRLTRSNKGTCYQFPIFLHAGGERSENLSADFRSFLDARYEHRYAPQEILGYIYAVLHAPSYRTRHAEFLRIDFPRVPFPQEAEDFEILSKLGWSLVEMHLLRHMAPMELAQYHGKGDHAVETVRYSQTEQAVWINKTQSFRPVPEDVWNFHTGGYQVLDKYLKSRKGRTLSLDEINHVASVAGALAFSIAQMEKIDKTYRKIFPSVDN